MLSGSEEALEQALRDPSRDSAARRGFLENYLAGPLAGYAQAHKVAGRYGALLEALEPSGEISNPPNSDLVVAVGLTAGYRYSADLGQGRFSGINPANGIYLTPPAVEARISITGVHRIRCLSIDHRFVAQALDRGDDAPFPDFGRLHRRCLIDPPIASVIASLWLACEDQAPPTRLLADHAALYIVQRLASLAATAPSAGRGGLAPWQIRRVTEAIAAATEDTVSLGALAELVGLSVYHFARSFKQSLGVPPHRYQRMLRIERARGLLEASELSVTEIALSVGFESSQSLARAFARELGVSPSEYRRRGR